MKSSPFTKRRINDTLRGRLAKRLHFKADFQRARFSRMLWRCTLRLLDTKFPVPRQALLSPGQRAQIQKLLQPGDLMVESNCMYPGWQLAALLTFGSRWMHAGIYIGDGIVIDAGTKPYVAQVPLAEFLKTSDVAVYRPKYATVEDRSAAIAFAIHHLGMPFNLKFDHANTNSFYCAQLLSSALLNMPHPILLRQRQMLWKTIVPPSSVTTSEYIDCIWSTDSNLFRRLWIYWPIMLGALFGWGAGQMLDRNTSSALLAILGAAIALFWSNSIPSNADLDK